MSVLLFNRFSVLETYLPNSPGRDISRHSLYSSLTQLTGSLEQVAQLGCGVSILGGVKNLNGHGPEEPAALVNSGLSKGAGLDNLQKCLLSFVTVNYGLE